jgi:hypothetical protein
VLQNIKAMPTILKWLTAVSLVPTLFVLGTLIPNGSVKVNGRPMANSLWWACGAGATVVVVATMMTFATLLLVQRSKYARPVLLFAMATTAMAGILINKLTESNVTAPLWPVIVNLATVAVIALYLYASKAVRKYFKSRDV